MVRKQLLECKLRAVNYPAPNNFDPTDSKQIRNLMVWLEDRLLRYYPPEKRSRDIDSSEWGAYSNNYLASIKCPFTESNPNALADWLLGKAILLEYKTESSCPLELNEAPLSSTENRDVFAHVDINGNEFKTAVAKLARIIQIPTHPDPMVVFKNKLSTENIDRALEEYGTKKIDMLKTSEVCLGFDVTDPGVRAAAVSLRLLNINEMRRLQDLANAAVVQVQKLTADPRTDEKLGKVGY